MFVLLILLYKNSEGQLPNIPNNCSEVISRLSKDWKSDSLASKGIRLRIYKQIRNCQVDKLTSEFLVKNFGAPIKRKFYSGNTDKNYVEYIYYYYDSCKIATEACFERLYISFVYDESETTLEYIDDGMECA
jgi:hypothetical protein